MDVKKAYSIWADLYDTNKNRTRDLEAHALRTSLEQVPFQKCLEIGCGTGKNTQWLIEKAAQITAVDLSEEMLAKAKAKVNDARVHFKQANINETWSFAEGHDYDLITFSLVLEHIADLDHIFAQTAAVLCTGGHVYIGELHPFKQYSGTKARFDDEHGRHVVECYTHNVSDFIQIPRKYGLYLVQLEEYFDDDDRTEIPRILHLLLQKR